MLLLQIDVYDATPLNTQASDDDPIGLNHVSPILSNKYCF
jgi:hypothetical protein